MADITSVDLARRVGEELEQASPDLLRAMVKTFAEALMGAEADAICGAPYGQPSEDRVNYRNGYRDRRWDTRAGTIELAIPRLRQGSYFPDWMLERRRRSEQRGRHVLPAGRARPGGWRSWPRRSETRACPRARCPTWPRAWMPRWSSSGPGRWTPTRTGSRFRSRSPRHCAGPVSVAAFRTFAGVLSSGSGTQPPRRTRVQAGHLPAARDHADGEGTPSQQLVEQPDLRAPDSSTGEAESATERRLGALLSKSFAARQLRLPSSADADRPYVYALPCQREHRDLPRMVCGARSGDLADERTRSSGLCR